MIGNFIGAPIGGVLVVESGPVAAVDVTLDDASISSAATLDLACQSSVTLDDATVFATGSAIGALGVLDVVLDDVVLLGDSTLRLPNAGGFGEEPKRRRRKSPNQRAEYHLNLALEKAFEPKRPVKRDIEPWLAEIIEPPSPIPEPEFNPQIAGLSDYVAQLQAQLAQRKFELSQMEADDELLLLSL